MAPNLSNTALLEAALQEIEGIVPDGGEPLPVQAQSGVICLLTAFDSLATARRTRISDAINAPFDALDNYDFFVRRRLLSATVNRTDYTLLRREMERQLEDLKFVKDYGTRGRVGLIEYRVENLQFTIPPAV